MKNYLEKYNYSRVEMEKIIERDDRRYKEALAAIPVIINEFGKYTGRRYGARTKEKIAESIKEKTGLTMYIDQWTYNDDIIVYNYDWHNYNDKVIIQLKNPLVGGGAHVLIDNVIQDLSDVYFDIANVHMTAATDETLDGLEHLLHRYAELEESIRSVCKAYNELKPSSARGLYYNG